MGEIIFKFLCLLSNWFVCLSSTTDSMSTFPTILCQHFWRFCVNISYDSVFAGNKVEGTECCERAILPEKALREKLNNVIEDEFSKVALRNTIKYFKPHSENDCVGATIKVLWYSLTKKEVPKPYQTLLKEIQKDSPVSSWLPREDTPESELSVAEAEFQVSFQNITKSWSMQLRPTHTSYCSYFNQQFQVSGSVVDLHLGTQPMDLVVFNVKRVHNIPVSTWWWWHWW